MKPWMLVLLGGLPLLSKLPYMVRAWRTSRPDQWDWLFLLAFALLTALLWPRLRAWRGSGDSRFWGGAGLGALLYGAGWWQPVHALAIVGALVFAWSMTGVAVGGRMAGALVPLFGILGLACTGTTYWIGYFSGWDGLTVKLVAGTALGLWAVASAWRRKLLPVRVVLFGMGLAVLLGLWAFPGHHYAAYPPFQPTLAIFKFGQFVGREIPPSDSDRRFFGNSRIRRAFFADDHSAVAVLEVGDLADVHKIHPAGYCLRAAGRQIVSDRLWVTRLEQRGFQVNEVLVDNRDGTFMLLWAWYSSAAESAGNFLFFRRSYTPGGGWRTYQAAVTGTGTGTPAEVAAARTVLDAFLAEWARTGRAKDLRDLKDPKD
ncbi:MAG: hypothetical protein WC708_07190 [Lentisphaeria bacterium]